MNTRRETMLFAEPPICASTIDWTVPKQWHLRKVRAELSGVLTFGFFARIVLVSVVVALGIRYLAERALGPLDFNWVRAICLSVMGGIGVLLLGVAEGCIPPHIRISTKGIDVLKGRRAFRVAFGEVVTMSIQGSLPPTLTFRKGARDYQYAIPESVDLKQLQQELARLSGKSVQIEQ